jgi:serine/threonine protein kinase
MNYGGSTLEPDWKNLTREDLDRGYVRRLNKDLSAKADIRLVEIDGHRAVHKDIRQKPGLVRHTLGSWLIEKEYRIYRRLPGCPGVPRLHGRPDRWSILVEYVEGESLRLNDPRLRDPAFFHRVCRLVEAIHARGVVHLDLRHRGNIIIAKDGQPYVIDFNGSFYLGGNPLARRLLPWLKEVDSFGLLKLKHSVTPDLLTEEEKARLRWFRVVRRFWVLKRYRPPQGLLKDLNHGTRGSASMRNEVYATGQLGLRMGLLRRRAKEPLPLA